MSINYFLLLAFCLNSFVCLASNVEVAVCEQRKDAKFSLVYLHGLDPQEPSLQEKQNREILQSLSLKHAANLLIPRSKILCKNKNLCWLHANAVEHEKVYKEILDATGRCVKNPVPIVLLGFSNGGYFASKVATRCYNGIAAVIASGSAGNAQDARVDQKRAPSCPPIYLTMGRRDLSFTKAEKFYAGLKAAGYQISFEPFSGSHELSKATLDLIMAKLRVQD
jgi:predicted esterase